MNQQESVLEDTLVKIKKTTIFWVICTVAVCMTVIFTSPVYSDWDGDIDEVTQQLDRDFQFGGKEDIKSSNIQQSNTQLREDTQIRLDEEAKALEAAQALATLAATPSPLSGTYTIGVFEFVYQVFMDGSFSAVGTSSIQTTVTFNLSGTITNNISNITITRTETTGPPTNYPMACSQTTTATGLITGAGEVGTTHSFTRSGLCNEAGTVNVLHTKIN